MLQATKSEESGRVLQSVLTNGCTIGKYCDKGSCTPIESCPVCSRNQRCRRFVSSVTSFGYTCVDDPLCSCASDNSFCTVAPSTSGLSLTCQPHPQRVFTTYTNCTGCTQYQECFNGTCIDPIGCPSCGPNQYCQQVATTDANHFAYVCKTSSLCTCVAGQFCHVAPVSPTYTFTGKTAYQGVILTPETQFVLRQQTQRMIVSTASFS